MLIINILWPVDELAHANITQGRQPIYENRAFDNNKIFCKAIS